jgi:methylated-DNA-[protein]-cysteine S-methyltransferase
MAERRRANSARDRSGKKQDSTRMTRGRMRAGDVARSSEVFYDKLDSSPLGTVYLAAGRRGLVAVGLATDERSFVRRVARASGQTPIRSATNLREAKRQMGEYLSGKRISFSLPVDLRGATPFQRAVLDATRRIRRGKVLTYGGLATRLHRPHAGRAVGQALAHNPLPVLIPCHRVVSREGELRGYLGDRIGLKAKLLALEGVPVKGNRCLMGRPPDGDR